MDPATARVRHFKLPGQGNDFAAYWGGSVKGQHLQWASEEQEATSVFYPKDSTEKDCLTFFSNSYGPNTIRANNLASLVKLVTYFLNVFAQRR